MTIFYWSWIAFTSATPLIALVVIIGFWSGAFVSLQAPIITGQATDTRVVGTMVGQVMCEYPACQHSRDRLTSVFQSFSQLIGPPVFGELLGHGTLEEQRVLAPRAIVFGGAMMTLSLGVMLWARFRLERRWIAKV